MMEDPSQIRNSAPKTENAWAIVSPFGKTPYILSSTIGVFRTDVLREWERDTGYPWKYFQRKGYRIIKVMVMPA